jgi:flagella basal body P-ring formation protein FlgA
MTVTVEREARVIGQGELQLLAERLLLETLPHEQERVIIGSIRLPSELLLPPGDHEWDLELTGPQRTIGSVSFELRALDANSVVGRAQGSAQIDVGMTLVEVTEDLERGATFTTENLREVEGTMARAPSGAVTSREQIVGLVTTQSLRAGTLLTERAATQPHLVRRGEVVTLIYESNGLRITDKAISTRDAVAGEEIVVQNLESRRSVRALVTGPRTVRALF